MDRRIPEALSTSRKGNVIVEGQELRDAGTGSAPRSARRRLTAVLLCRGSLHWARPQTAPASPASD
jgi:hypothetical protein